MEHKTVKRSKTEQPENEEFSQRLKQLIAEFGSRYALAKVSGIPASTLQTYEAGSKPGMDALTTLARVGNVDLNWLLTGKGEIRPTGIVPGALLADFLVVDQYQMGHALSMSIVIGQIPFSRHLLESRLRLHEASHQTLLAVEADANLFEIARGDLVLVDRNQNYLGSDGIYLLDLPGIVLRAVTRCVGDKVKVVSPESHMGLSSVQSLRAQRPMPWSVEELRRSELLGAGRYTASKVAGRAVWIGRGI
jgi:transcriptional regulator with XRE-family HTH domain